MNKQMENRERLESKEHPGHNDVVYHANYLIWFEVGRVELLRSMGYDYKQMEAEDGISIAVVEVTARYKAPARYDDELIVRTRIKVVRAALIKFGYQILRAADGVLLWEGETTHVTAMRAMIAEKV